MPVVERGATERTRIASQGLLDAWTIATAGNDHQLNVKIGRHRQAGWRVRTSSLGNLECKLRGGGVWVRANCRKKCAGYADSLASTGWKKI